MRRRKIIYPVFDPNFRSEAEMRDFVAENLDRIEPGLHHCTLFDLSVEFPCRVRNGWNARIDILAEDADGRIVVVEVKRKQARPEALGQLFGYMAWIMQNLAPHVLPIRGMIVATSYTPLLELALHNFTQFPVSLTIVTDRNAFDFTSPEFQRSRH
jgi:RecB family endonuclease NucS